MTRRPVLTLAHLRKHAACPTGLARFRRHFPEGAALTVANLTRARRAGLDVGWCVSLLDDDLFTEFGHEDEAAFEVYEQAIDPALEEYRRAIRPHLDAYGRSRDRIILRLLAEQLTREARAGGGA